MDFYAILGVSAEAGPRDVRRAYRSLAKTVHPDVSGEEGHRASVLLNEAYKVLSDPHERAAFDRDREVWEGLLRFDPADPTEEGYTGQPLSEWFEPEPDEENPDPEDTGPVYDTCATEEEAAAQAAAEEEAREREMAGPRDERAVFVDEVACTGCTLCVDQAPGTFELEEDFGRARVVAQWTSSEDEIQAACDVCPVGCIHWVPRGDLPSLEFVMRNKVKRVEVGLMNAGMGHERSGLTGTNVFSARDSFVRQRLIRQAYHAAEVRAAQGETTLRESEAAAAAELDASAAAMASAAADEDWFWDFVQRQRGEDPAEGAEASEAGPGWEPDW